MAGIVKVTKCLLFLCSLILIFLATERVILRFVPIFARIYAAKKLRWWRCDHPTLYFVTEISAKPKDNQNETY